MKKIFIGIGLALVFFAGIFVANLFFHKKEQERKEVQSVVLLEEVKKVCKLVTIEQGFLETYDEKNFRPVTLYLPFPTTFQFSKKATLELSGTILVGYNMEKVSITADSSRNVLLISNLPQPEILAIDHELKYKGLEESWFNTFSPEDLTLLNKGAKELMRKHANESGIFDEAREQGNQMLGVITYMATSVGWTVEVENDLIPVIERDTFPD